MMSPFERAVLIALATILRLLIGIACGCSQVRTKLLLDAGDVAQRLEKEAE